MSSEFKNNVVDEILGELAVYQNPDLIKEQYRKLLDTSKANKVDLEKYTDLLTNVRYAWQKTLRYEIYFKDFYPTSDRIDEVEALNHHIHAYLEDMTIFKNKIEVLLGKMKNDVRKVAQNNKKTDEFFAAGIQKTNEVFEGILKHRGDHHHRGRRFLDKDLLKAENAQNNLKLLENPFFNDLLNPALRPEFIAKQEMVKGDSFEIARKRWVEMARKNNEQGTGYLNAILESLRPTLYQFLNIKRTKDIFNPQ